MTPAILERLGACREAREYAAQFKTLKEAWQKCERGDWLLWLAARVEVDRRLVVEAACDCAEQASIYAGPDEILAAVWAIDSARRHARGETDLEEVEAARAAARAAAWAEARAAEAAEAAWAAAAAAWAEAASGDKYLLLSANLALEILRDLGSPGAAFVRRDA